MRLADPKRLIPLIVALLAGLITLSSYVQPNALSTALLDIAALLTAAGLLLGVLNVLNLHRRRIMTRAADWPYSIVLVAALLTTFVLVVLPGVGGPFARAIFRYVYQPLTGSILALLTFFALRAAWRALQLRPGEASIILGVAIVFLLASGPWAALVPGLSAALDWIEAYPALGVARGLLLGVGIGALVASARLLLGLDQPYLDR
jgi:hypothetical protein